MMVRLRNHVKSSDKIVMSLPLMKLTKGVIQSKGVTVLGTASETRQTVRDSDKGRPKLMGEVDLRVKVPLGRYAFFRPR